MEIQMSPATEKKLLEHLVRSMDAARSEKRRSKTLEFILWAGVTLGFLALFQVFGTPTWWQFSSGILLVLGGIALGYKLRRELMISGWTTLSPYIDRAAIEKRIDEVGA